jgi:hypothetical protein
LKRAAPVIGLHTARIHFDTRGLCPVSETEYKVSKIHHHIQFNSYDLRGYQLAQALLKTLPTEPITNKESIAMRLLNFFMVISVRLGAGSALVLLRNLWP